MSFCPISVVYRRTIGCRSGRRGGPPDLGAVADREERRRVEHRLLMGVEVVRRRERRRGQGDRGVQDHHARVVPVVHVREVAVPGMRRHPAERPGLITLVLRLGDVLAGVADRGDRIGRARVVGGARDVALGIRGGPRDQRVEGDDHLADVLVGAVRGGQHDARRDQCARTAEPPVRLIEHDHPDIPVDVGRVLGPAGDRRCGDRRGDRRRHRKIATTRERCRDLPLVCCISTSRPRALPRGSGRSSERSLVPTE